MERIAHNPHNQSITVHESPTFLNADHSPAKVYAAIDEHETLGLFLSRDAADWVLGCRDAVRKSRQMRGK